MVPVFYFGAMSPYAWFAAERIDELIPTARWQGVFLGGIFKSSGRSSWALGERRAQGMAECEARAKAHGLGAIHWPDPWPTNDLAVARAMLFAQRKGLLKPYAREAMRLAFREGRDLSEPTVVLEAGERSGIERAELETALSDPEVKDSLRAATDEAIARGVSGVPTVCIGDQIFWGDDRLQDAAAAASSSTSP
jgi:2-hydroxychromene-2-carboxylate isomerase